MQQTVVKPPAAAERVPLSTVSLCSNPGSRRWVCRSTKPGVRSFPEPSTVSAPSAGRSFPIASILPSRILRSATRSKARTGSNNRAFFIKVAFMVNAFPPLSFGLGPLGLPRQQVQQGHPHRDPVLHLVEDQRIRPVRHFG